MQLNATVSKQVACLEVCNFTTGNMNKDITGMHCETGQYKYHIHDQRPEEQMKFTCVSRPQT